jgi:hypothetical protein
VGGLDKQLAAAGAALLAKAGHSVADPSPLRVQTAIERLEDVDPLEIAALYAGAEPDDQRLIEVVAETLGNQPVRRDGRLFFEALLPRETITATLIARAEKIDAAGAAQVRDLQRIQNAFIALVGVAKQMLSASLPSGVPTRVA